MNILCFGIAREIIGSADYKLEYADLKTVGDLKACLKTTYPEFKAYKDFQIAVNQSFSDDDTVILPTDELAIIPPVSGG